MAFNSILYKQMKEGIKEETAGMPAFFIDLNLDQIIDAITMDKKEYNLKPYFYTPLKDVDTILYRHEVMRDMEERTLFEYIKAFAQAMRTMREQLVQVEKLYYKGQKESWFLDSVDIYCEAVNSLKNNLCGLDLKSRGFSTFREYLINYTGAGYFTSLEAETKKLKADLASIKYCILIKGNCIKVRRYEDEIDYSVDVEETFEKFRQGEARSYKVNYTARPNMNHVEAKILDFVAALHPEIFMELENYCSKNRNYLDETISLFDREIQFYMAFLEYIEALKEAGLRFCYPQIAETDKEIYDYEGFDLALANKLVAQKTPVVCNDFYLKDRERIFVVSGPNQGGKTTFARTFGQLHYLASIGCPVPGRAARLFLFDNMFTHFEKEENIKNLRGKLQDDLVRIYDILKQATSNSIVIMNEIFTSTTLEDAIFLGKKVMEKITKLDILCVCVTFIDELASLNDKTVSVVSTVVPENPALRTYKLVRRPADGLSYAATIAEKYRLTYNCLKERITG